MKFNIVRLGAFVLTLLALLGLAALFGGCGKGNDSCVGPTCPTPTTCTDSKATNFGGPLPCTYPAPAESYIKIIGKSPPDGTTMEYNTLTSVTVEYGVSQVDMDLATKSNQEIRVMTCLSVDRSIPTSSSFGCWSRPTTGASGQVDMRPWVRDTVTQTKFVVVRLIVGPVAQTDLQRTVMQEVSESWTLNWTK